MTETIEVRYRSKHLIPLALIAIVSCIVLAKESHAAANESWEESKARSEQFSAKGECSEAFNQLWPWAKQGNLEARALIFLMLVPPPHMDGVLMPGSFGDLVSTWRHLTILAVHTSGYNGEWFNIYERTIANLYTNAKYGNSAGGKSFLNCVQNTPSQDCADLAVKNKLVPSFENYAHEIDSLLAQGAKASCITDSIETK